MPLPALFPWPSWSEWHAVNICFLLLQEPNVLPYLVWGYLWYLASSSFSAEYVQGSLCDRIQDKNLCYAHTPSSLYKHRWPGLNWAPFHTPHNLFLKCVSFWGAGWLPKISVCLSCCPFINGCLPIVSYCPSILYVIWWLKAKSPLKVIFSSIKVRNQPPRFCPTTSFYPGETYPGWSVEWGNATARFLWGLQNTLLSIFRLIHCTGYFSQTNFLSVAQQSEGPTLLFIHVHSFIYELCHLVIHCQYHIIYSVLLHKYLVQCLHFRNFTESHLWVGNEVCSVLWAWLPLWPFDLDLIDFRKKMVGIRQEVEVPRWKMA